MSVCSLQLAAFHNLYLNVFSKNESNDFFAAEQRLELHQVLHKLQYKLSIRLKFTLTKLLLPKLWY